MNIGNGFIEFLANSRDSSGKLSGPLAARLVQGLLGTLPCGPPTSSVLHSTSALDVANGVIGAGATPGVAGDTQLVSVYIPKNAGPATLTIAGFINEAGTAKTLLLTGSTSLDMTYNFTALVNSGGPMTLQASVADIICVTTAPFGSPAIASPSIAPAAPNLTLVGGTAVRTP